MTDLERWPSLFGFGLPSGILEYQRAVRGKVHRAATDYRWIAVSNGFEPPAGVLEASAIGSEDDPAGMFCWRPLEGGFVAVRGYPSRARDSAGRPGGMEKQFVFWKSDGALPAAAAAFLLLEAASQFTDAIWWESWNDPRWQEPSFRLPIAEDQCLPLGWKIQNLTRSIESGLAELAASASPQMLAAFYDRFLAGEKPALLGVGAPVSPLALAALLLPLPGEVASTLSISGWLPSRQLRLERLANWSALACPAEFVRAAAPSSAALELAKAVSSRNPAGLRPYAFTPRQSISAATEPAGSAIAGANAGAEFLPKFLCSDARGWDPAEFDIDACPLMEFGELVSLIRKIQHYEKEVLQDNRFPSDPLRQEARRLHLGVKGDLARALLYVIAPDHRTIEALPPRDEAVVPALWFAPLLGRDHWSRFERYSASAFAALVLHSLDVRRVRDPLGPWLDLYVESIGDTGRRELIAGAARSPGAS